MRKRWKSAAQCTKDMLANFAVVGIGIAVYEQKIWPALLIGMSAAILAVAIALVVSDD